MDKYKSTEAPWNPQTPVKPIAPICRKTAEEQSNENQAVEGNRLVGKTMAGLEHLSCLDLMALANSASVHFSGQIPWANSGIEVPSRNVVCGGPEMEIEMSKTKTNREMMQKANEAVESLSSASNIVAEQIKTPEKPKRKKHRPKVVKDADPKPQTPRKPTPRRKYARKKDQESTPSTHAKKLCRRALDFEDESFKPNAVEKESASRQKQLEESKDWLTSAPSTPNRKRNQSNRKRKEPKNNVGVMSQAAKRRQGKQPTCNIHPSQIQYNEHCLYFTNLQQQGMRCNAQEDSKCYTFTSQPSTSMEEKQSNVPLDSTETPIKKKTARFRNLSCINKDEMPQNNKLLVDTPVTLRKKKQKTLVPACLSPDELWKQLYSVEAISEKLRLLDINRENSETALLPYSQGNEIILFRGGAGAIVPLPPVKKRHARPRVDLDNETERVWKLLVENIDSSGIDGSDEEKEKWWKEERSVLEGRAHSFIARMHLVLGDRRFTAWKGSVVDSVVGVFLTQNVSDHLSSSAFMSLAAAFPAPSVPTTSFDVGTSSMPPIQIAYLEETCSEIASSAAHEPVGKITIPKAQLDSDGKGSSVEVDDETYLVQNTERVGSSSVGEHHASFVKLLQGLESQGTVSVQESNQYENSRQEILVSSNPGILQESPKASPGDSSSQVKDFKSLKGQTRSSDDSNEPCCCSSSKPSAIPDINESTSCLHLQQGTQTPSAPDELNLVDDATFNAKGKKVLKEKQEGFDWDSLRKEAQGRKGKRERTTRTMDSVDWEAIRSSDVSEVAATIKSRGMNNKLAERIQGFLDRLVIEHGSIDLEWLRDVPPDRAKEYLLSFRGLGLKSVECVRLLTLHHLAFPVDTNVGRIAVRLGWVPLQPLPESLQLHLLEMYPVLESIQKYLWPRLCKLDQKTLYELHYQMITFGKVFCTKSKPNCNACPMRGECRHFASAFASARLALPDIEKGIGTPDKNPYPLHLPEPLQRDQGSEVVKHSKLANNVTCCEPIVEVPASPELECAQVSIADIEDAFFEDPEEIPTIKLDMVALTSNLKKIMELRDENMSTALVALTAEAASIPMPKLKNISQLRTEHQVYELPDSHPLLFTLEKREPDDPCSYLLAIWTPGETTDSVQPIVRKCVSQEVGKLCDEETCFSCNNIKETRSQIVRGTILIPCRTAMKGSFPLNGTYFQVNEVFADHDSSLRPIDVPREWLWNLPRKTVYFGTSIPSIFKGLPMETIQQCFWRGYVCVRGFDRKTRGPKPLIARLHFPASKMGKSQGKSSNPRGA